MPNYFVNNICEYINCVKDIESVPISQTKPEKPSLPALKGVYDKVNNNDMSLSVKELYSYYYDVNHIDHIGKNHYFYFRGQANTAYQDKLSPTIYREDEKHDEYYYFNNMKRRCPNELGERNTSISKLTYLQHYGCPTRLLDITANPLVALYFACSKSKDTNGLVYVFRAREEDVLFDKNDKVNMLSKLSEIKKEDQEKLRFQSYYNIMKGKFPQLSNSKYSDNAVEHFYHNIKMDNPAFEREINPIDLLSPIFVQTALDNPRILKQDGAFILCGLDKDVNESNFKLKKLVCEEIIISASAKESILYDLDKLCINEASLFPEVEKVAEYLKGL